MLDDELQAMLRAQNAANNSEAASAGVRLAMFLGAFRAALIAEHFRDEEAFELCRDYFLAVLEAGMAAEDDE